MKDEFRKQNVFEAAVDKRLINYPCDGCGKSQANPMLSQLVFVVLCDDCKDKHTRGSSW